MKKWQNRDVMMVSRSAIGVFVAAITLAPAGALAGADGDWRSMFDIYGDFRFRVEQDWDSERSSGRDRFDREIGRAHV